MYEQRLLRDDNVFNSNWKVFMAFYVYSVYTHTRARTLKRIEIIYSYTALQKLQIIKSNL